MGRSKKKSKETLRKFQLMRNKEKNKKGLKQRKTVQADITNNFSIRKCRSKKRKVREYSTVGSICLVSSIRRLRVRA